MPLGFITESNHWKITEDVYDRVRKQLQQEKPDDGVITELLSDLAKYMEWQRYVAGRRNHKWDDNLRPMNRDRNGYTDSEMMHDFKRLTLDDDRYPQLWALVADVQATHEECEIRQFEIDELEWQLQSKLEELEKAHELFRDRMCEIKRQSLRVRSTVRARPVNFRARDNESTVPKCRTNADDRLSTLATAGVRRIFETSAEAEARHHTPQQATPPLLQEILELSAENYASEARKSKKSKRWKARWRYLKGIFNRSNH